MDPTKRESLEFRFLGFQVFRYFGFLGIYYYGIYDFFT